VLHLGAGVIAIVYRCDASLYMSSSYFWAPE
jgi:hypothetical protein